MIRLFSHYVSSLLVLIGVLEALALFCSMVFGAYYQRSAISAETLPDNALLLFNAGFYTLAMVASLTAMGLYRRNFGDDAYDVVLRIVAGFLFGTCLMAMLYYVVPLMSPGRLGFGVALISSLLGVAAARLLYLRLVEQRMFKQRVLIFGDEEPAQELDSLAAESGRAFWVVGHVGPELRGQRHDGSELHASSLSGLLEQEDVDEVVIAVRDRRKYFPVEEFLSAKARGVVITDYLEFLERETGKIEIDALRPSTLIFCDGFRDSLLHRGSKRVIDLCASALLLFVAWPVMLLTALALLIESRGKDPVFYRQQRVGKDGICFDVIKFRSMRTDAEKDGAQWAKQDDDRITAVGHFIRKTRIDELPQLLNVFNGHMSFVGPRPERPEFVSQLAEQIPYFELRQSVKPGITGWAQICYPYGASVEDAKQKLQYDIYYIKNYSIFLDMTVLIQTVHVILWGQGAR